MTVLPLIFYFCLGTAFTSYVIFGFCWIYIRRNRFKPGDPIEFDEENWNKPGYTTIKGLIVGRTKKHYYVHFADYSLQDHKTCHRFVKINGNKKFRKRNYVIYDAANQCNIILEPS